MRLASIEGGLLRFEKDTTPGGARWAIIGTFASLNLERPITERRSAGFPADFVTQYDKWRIPNSCTHTP